MILRLRMCYAHIIFERNETKICHWGLLGVLFGLMGASWGQVGAGRGPETPGRGPEAPGRAPQGRFFETTDS